MAIVYIVSGCLYRNSSFKEDELINIYKEFRNKNVLQARKEAFNYFKSVIEVLLESKGLEYQDDTQAEKCLQEFYSSNMKERHPKLSYVLYDNDEDKLLTISFTTDVNPYITKTGLKIYKEEYIIKTIGYQSELMTKRIKDNLIIEKQVIDKYGKITRTMEKL